MQLIVFPNPGFFLVLMAVYIEELDSCLTVMMEIKFFVDVLPTFMPFYSL